MGPRSNARHGLVVDDIRFRVQRGVHTMLVDHVPPPVVLPGETLSAGSGIGALWLEAVELAGLLMFVVDVTVKVRLGTESLVAVTMGALMRPVMVPPVMVQLMDLIKWPVAHVAGVYMRRGASAGIR